jgi:hypothetical protein
MKKYSRYAIYYAPPKESSLEEFGRYWFGWDPLNAKLINNKRRINYLNRFGIKNLINIDKNVLIAKKYGFHGTLIPPFKLNKNYSTNTLFKKTEEIAKKLKKFKFYKFKLKKINNFYAFVQNKKNNNINKLSNRLVRELFKFRSPLTKKEIDRRNPSKLSKLQLNILYKWGYPYLMSEFNFHMTLASEVTGNKLYLELKKIERNKEIILNEINNFDKIYIFGENQKGMFENLENFSLS